MYNTCTRRLGMTIIELLIASTILIVILTMVSSSYANFSASKRKILLSNEVHNETRFLVERIVREIHNGTIDYQGYWRENILNDTANNWLNEGVNPKGVDSQENNSTPGFNSIKNCKKPNPNLDGWDTNYDTDTLEKRSNILFNYRYQFIFPGKAFPEGNDYHNQAQNIVHLNCVTDNYNEADGYNVYDDEPAYGRGPRAFNKNEIYNADTNTVQGSKMLWDWDLQDNGGNPNPIENNNPPLLLVKSNESKDAYARTAIRYDDNKINLMRFVTPENGMDNDTPPDQIPDKWVCEKDFQCGPNGSTSYDSTYTWSQKAENANGAGDVNKGEDNGIGTITDTDLHWEDITPEKIEITYFDFILSPVKDPHRAFYEKDKIQKPQITLIIEAQAKRSAMKGIKGLPPKIRIQTTATPRIWDLIEVDN